MKNIRIFYLKISLVVKFPVNLNRRVFVMGSDLDFVVCIAILGTVAHGE